jgi:curved DNA-binding protein CbpA
MMPTEENYYEVLEVPPGADAKAIKKAYRALALKWHPDKAGTAGGEKFGKIVEAYACLSDEKKRQAYDQTLLQKTTSMQADTAQVASPGRSEELKLKPGVKVEDIVSEFSSFTDELCKENPGKYKKEDFSYSQITSPNGVVCHVFSFPDEASADAFMQRLLAKDFIYDPALQQKKESQPPMPPLENKQQAMKQQLLGLKEEDKTQQKTHDAEQSAALTTRPTPR